MQWLESILNNSSKLLDHGALGILFLGMVLSVVLIVLFIRSWTKQNREATQQLNLLLLELTKQGQKREERLVQALIDNSAIIASLKEITRSMRGIVANCPYRLKSIIEESEQSGSIRPETCEEIKEGEEETPS